MLVNVTLSYNAAVKRTSGTAAARYVFVVAIVAVIVAATKALKVNPTTVALLFLVAVLLVSAYWGLRYALLLATIATAVFNFFFLPPYGTFTIADPHNWVALVAFLVTALVASNLSERARREARDAELRRREVERLYTLAQRLLSADNVLELLNALPLFVADTFNLSGTAVWIAERGPAYRSSPEIHVDEGVLRSTLSRFEPIDHAGVSYVPLRIGMRTVGVIALFGESLSRGTQEAIGSLVGLSIERARAVEELSENRAMQENEKLRSALLDSVTHEFRTPLTGIKASVSSLLSSDGLNEQQRTELLTVIEEETDRLNRLIGQAAEMAQLDSGRFTLDVQPCSVGEIVDSAVVTARTALQHHPVEIAVSRDMPEIEADFERMREVVVHLLENAGKYSAAGMPIRVTAERDANRILISVADQGPGIDPFEQNLIFDKFYRGRHQRYTASGTGMGLAIVKVIVEAHGGKIDVVSQPGQGTVFSVSLPLPQERVT